MFNSKEEALNWLFVQKKLTKRENLERITKCASLLDLKLNYKIIHIAGTNGKGSTATMIKNILKRKYKVGLFISPFIISFNERIEINDNYISDNDVLKYINYLYDFSEKYQSKYNDVIPFFELTLLMALLYFDDQNIDYAVIECGLGGRLDSTNFLKSDLSIITNVGYDHMAQLGDTLEEISYHKMGIIKENSISLVGVDESLLNSFISYANKMNTKLIWVNNNIKDINTSNCTSFKYKDISYKTNLLGDYQAFNASLAIEAVNYFDNSFTVEEINDSLMNTFHPGRLEHISDKPLFFIDGAHNVHAMNALISFLKKYNNKKIHILFTALHDKSYKEMIALLDTVANDYIFTTIQDKRKTELNDFLGLTNKPYQIVSDYREAISLLLANRDENDLCIATGSLHFISEIRNYIKK